MLSSSIEEDGFVDLSKAKKKKKGMVEKGGEKQTLIQSPQ